MRGESFPGMLEFLLLATIKKNGKMYGYQTYKYLKPLMGQLHNGTVFQTIAKLEGKKYLASLVVKEKRWGNGAGYRIYYTITPEGELALARVHKVYTEISKSAD